MKAADLISFLLSPPPGKIRCINSPFANHDVFSFKQAERWIRSGRAEITCGVLVFSPQHIVRMRGIVERENADVMDTVKRDANIDLVRSSGERVGGSIAEWRARPTGMKSKMPGAPVERVQQMKLKWEPRRKK